MNAFRTIRERLKMTQSALAAELDQSQANVSFYERGQTVPPQVARKLIKLAADNGVAIGFDDIYADIEAPGEAAPERKAA